MGTVPRGRKGDVTQKRVGCGQTAHAVPPPSALPGLPLTVPTTSRAVPHLDASPEALTAKKLPGQRLYNNNISILFFSLSFLVSQWNDEKTRTKKPHESASL